MLIVAKQRRTRPSLTPLIDVVFLLLIFFMIVSRLTIEQQSPLALTASADAHISTDSDDKNTHLTLLTNGQLNLDGQQYSLEQLANSAFIDKNLPVTLSLAEKVTFQQTLTMLEHLQAADFPTVTLATGGAEL